MCQRTVALSAGTYSGYIGPVTVSPATRRGEGLVGISCHIRATCSGTRRFSGVNEVYCRLSEKLTLTSSYVTYSWWALRDSNPRPQPCEGCALTS
jgi:hypothetical protein